MLILPMLTLPMLTLPMLTLPTNPNNREQRYRTGLQPYLL
jgi:hypothetical protein